MFKVSRHHNQSRQYCVDIVNFEIIQYFFKGVSDFGKTTYLVFSYVLVSGKSIFAVDIHPDGSKFATGGQGMHTVRIGIFVPNVFFLLF